MNLPNGTLLQGGKYKIIRFINSGGFGNTYEALHVMLNKRVAIKEFFVKDFCNRDETTSDVLVGIKSREALVGKLKKKFIDEARALCQLEHPGIVRVNDVFEDYSTAYFVMDYIDGKSLSEIVKDYGPMPEPQALKYIHQVSLAMRYVHSLNRLHLDLKPGNILVDNADNAVIIDFGASKQYDEQDGENNSTLLGKTIGYAPLEQMGNDVSTFLPATDIYAIGATLYKLITGNTPPPSNLMAQGDHEIEVDPSLASPSTINAIKAAMRVSKRQRPQTIDEFLAILDGRIPPSSDEESTRLDVNPEHYNNGGGGGIPNYPNNDPYANTNNGNGSYGQYNSQQNDTDYQTPYNPEEPKKKSKTWIFVLIGVVVLILIILLALPGGDNDSKIDTPEGAGSEQVDNNRMKTADLTYKNAKDVTFTYTGECINDSLGHIIPDGQGEGKYKEGTYTGQYVNGIRQGKGKYVTTDNSNTFEGTYDDDQYAEGKLTFEDGSYYEGTFKNNEFYTGKFIDNKGKPEGTITNGKMN